MSFFTKLDEATLRARSFLLLTKSENQPQRRTNRTSADGKGIKGILFRFPQRLLVTPSTLSIDDNELKFVSQAGTTQMEASFDLQKMVDDEGTDL
jgi:hypothetical protein